MVDGAAWGGGEPVPPRGSAPPTGSTWYQPVPPETTARTNGLAVASLVCGLLWLFFLGSVLAIVFGHVARAGIRRSGGWQRGAGMALAGLALGYLWLALLVIGIASTAWS